MTAWRSIQLGDLVELITKGTTPSKVDGGFSEAGINFVKSEAISYDGKIDQSTFVFISNEVHEKYKRSQLKENDILFSMAGVFLGKNALVPKEILPANTNQAVAIIRLDQQAALPKFVHYFLRQKSVIEFVNNISGQSAQPNINFQEIRSIDILLPSLEEQKAIATILSSLDDKIDLLHRQNRTLEAMAETLFRQWFVEEAQESQPITNLVEFNPPRKLPKGTIAPYLEMAALSTTTFNPDESYDREFSSGTKFINGDTLLARITPCLENGKAGYITFLKEGQVGWGSTEYIIMRPIGALHLFFGYVLARNKTFREYAEGCMSGSSGRQRVEVEHLKKFDIGIVSDTIIEEFNSIAESIAPKLHHNMLQIGILEKLRDTLLPKLMSGEVRVTM